MPARSPDPHGDLDLSTLPSVLRRKAGRIAVVAAGVGLLTYGALLLVPSRYTSEAQIRIGAPSLADSSRGAASAETVALSVDKEAIASRVQELRSPDLAKKLAAELRLAARPEFNSALGSEGLLGGILHSLGLRGSRAGETVEERVLAAYYRALQVYQVKDTRVITLSFTARDGDLAARAANRLIELYEVWLRERGVTESSDAHAWLVPEIEKRTRELSAAEAAVERFRATANLYRGGGSQPSDLAQQQLSDLASELTRVHAQRSEAEARAQAARELMRRNAPDAIPDVQKSPVIQGLIAQRVRVEREYAEAASQLLPAHPRMKQLAANVADVRRQIQREAASVVSGLEREVKALTLREELQKRTIEEAKAGLGSKADDRVRLAQLEDEVKAKRGELEGLRQRYEASRSRGTSQSVPVEVQVIATARPSSIPSRPNRLQIALLAAAATFVLGLVAVLFRELLSAGSRSVAPGRPAARSLRRENAEETVLRPTLPVQARPRISAGGLGQISGGTKDDGETLGSIAAVVDRLIANAAGQTGYRTLIVGQAIDTDVRGEAVELASALSRAGRQVVLVDWSLDGIGLAPDLGVASSPGFTNLLGDDASFEDVIRPIAESALHFVPCGTARPAGAGDIDPDRINLLLDALDEAYEDVVITGPYAAARDYFRAIEGRVDAGVLVGSVIVPDDADVGSEQRLLGFDVTEIDVIHLNTGRTSSSNRQGGRRSGSRGTTSSQALFTAT
jgi:uncharacterized protein involved in exopolysaccharide biosynthesis